MTAERYFFVNEDWRCLDGFGIENKGGHVGTPLACPAVFAGWNIFDFSLVIFSVIEIAISSVLESAIDESGDASLNLGTLTTPGSEGVRSRFGARATLLVLGCALS